MAKFSYTGTGSEGQAVSGQIESGSLFQASETLHAQGTRVLSIEAETPRSTLFRREQPLSAGDLALLSDQLAAMAESGLPLAPAVRALAQDVESPRLRRVLKDMVQAVEGGASLDEALARHSESFPPVFINLVRAGEQTGNLPGVLAQLSAHSQRMLNLRFSLHEALAYPLLLLGMLTVLVVTFSYTVLPAFESIFQQLSGGRARLPVPTAVALGLGRLIRAPGPGGWAAILAVAAGVYFLSRLWTRSASGQRVVDSVRVRVPLFGKYYRASATGRFFSTLGLLVANRASAVDGIELAAAASGNRVFQDRCALAAVSVARGESVADALAATGLFRQGTCWVIRQGGQQNTLDQALLRIAETYERELDRTGRTLALLLGPAITVIVGMVVGSIVIALFMPIMQLSTMVGM